MGKKLSTILRLKKFAVLDLCIIQPYWIKSCAHLKYYLVYAYLITTTFILIPYLFDLFSSYGQYCQKPVVNTKLITELLNDAVDVSDSQSDV